MSLKKLRKYPDAWRLDADVRSDSGEILKTLRGRTGVSLTEVVRRAMACYDLGLQTDFAGGSIWIEDEVAAHRLLPEPPFVQEAEYLTGLSINVNKAQADLLETIQALKGHDHGETVDFAVHYYGNLADAATIGHRIIQVLPDGWGDIELIS